MKFVKNSIALLLAPILLWAGMGFSVSKHYCLGMLKSESFYGPAERCAMHSKQDVCSNSESSIDFDCCDDDHCSVPGIQVARTQVEYPSLVDDLPWIKLRNRPFFGLTLFKPTFQFSLHNLALPPPEGRLILWQRFLI